jgi:hypothetical protein
MGWSHAFGLALKSELRTSRPCFIWDRAIWSKRWASCGPTIDESIFQHACTYLIAREFGACGRLEEEKKRQRPQLRPIQYSSGVLEGGR